MTRQLFLAITLIGTAVLLNSAAEAVSAAQCEDRTANCLGRCADRTGGAGDWGGHQNKCLPACDRKLIRCIIRTR
jgi:hypothetical protein